MTRIDKKKFEAACKKSGGVGAVVARAIGVNRTAIYHYLKKHPEMKDFLEDEGEQILDIAENIIDKEIMAGNIEVSMWALVNRKRGRARGYGPKQVVANTGFPTTVRFIEMSNIEIKKQKANSKKK